MQNHPKTTPRWARDKRAQKILGVVMIVKDEAKNLPELFASLADVADEVVVADTGSKDGTVGICRAWQTTLLSVRWENNFAKARNRAITAASAKYLIWLDGDDRLPEETIQGLIKLRDETLQQATEPKAYDLIVRNVGSTRSESFVQTRIVPRLNGVRFEKPVHEQIAPSLDRLGLERVATDLVIHHTGYADEKTERLKNERNAAILRASLKADPNDPHTLIHLGLAYGIAQEHSNAERLLSKALGLPAVKGGQLEAEVRVARGTFRALSGNKLGARNDYKTASELWREWAIPQVLLADLELQEGNEEAGVLALANARMRSFLPGILAMPLDRARSNMHVMAAYVARKNGDRETHAAECEEAYTADETSVRAALSYGRCLLDRERVEEAVAVLEPLGESEEALESFVDVSTAIARARAAAGDLPSASAVLAPLLEIFAERLGYADDVSPLDLVRVLLQAGYAEAAQDMTALHQIATRIEQGI